MPLRAEGFVREKVLLDDLATDEELEREGRKHVQSEAEPSDVDEGICLCNYEYKYTMLG
jgi:hypothetical protein